MVNRFEFPVLPIRLPSLFKTLKLCPKLERLVLFARLKEPYNIIPYAPLQDSILPFVKRMPHLVALYLACFPFDVSDVEQQLMTEIVPTRKAFWFHLGEYLLKVCDPTVPRIHYEGIVNPVVCAPPTF